MAKTLYPFIKESDSLSTLINEKANDLFQKLKHIDIQKIALDDVGKDYILKHHLSRRLDFSLKSSAAIIYHSVKRTNKNISDLIFVDYGAGIGTLFLLAAMLGFKKAIYNDHLISWEINARALCGYLGIHINDYIIGDVEELIAYGKKNNLSLDIVASRNVIEHIYDLKYFYEKIYQSGIITICYATTTANYHNIAMRLKHYFYHKKLEKNLFKKQRSVYIKELVPGINKNDLKSLIELTRGKAFKDFTITLELYFNKKTISKNKFLSSNTCDCRTGVWAEHIIPKAAYSEIIPATYFNMEYLPGFWDTNYKYKWVNIITNLFNKIINFFGKKGYWFSPFVNVIAHKRQK